MEALQHTANRIYTPAYRLHDTPATQLHNGFNTQSTESPLIFYIHTLLVHQIGLQDNHRTGGEPCFAFAIGDFTRRVADFCFQTFLAAASAPLAGTGRLLHVILWVWFHILQFDVANQIINPEEDALNKKDRPLPSKRITLNQAFWLRWALIPVCFGFSALYSTQALYASVVVNALTILYNECAAHSGHWIVRNGVCAITLASFEVGATLLAG